MPDNVSLLGNKQAARVHASIAENRARIVVIEARLEYLEGIGERPNPTVGSYGYSAIDILRIVFREMELEELHDKVRLPKFSDKGAPLIKMIRDVLDVKKGDDND